MMRQDLALKMLEREVVLCLEDESFSNAGIVMSREDTRIMVRYERGGDGRPGVFKLECADFDAQPPSVSMLDPASGEELPMERWAPGVPHSVHPVTGRPFVCIQGVAEYHSHPSHLDDSWDRYRNRFRIPQTVRRLLQKAGAIP